MSSNLRQTLIKDILAQLPHGQPFDLADLEQFDVSAFLAAKYVRSGWLQRLAQGTYAFPNDTLQLDACLLFLQKHVQGFHVGGKTALTWQGIRHNVSSKATIHLWGTQRFVLPDWFVKRFPTRYFYRDLFDSKTLQLHLVEQGLTSLTDHAEGLMVSCRERALLEVLDEVGVSQDLEEATHLFESFTSLRTEVIGPLLETCKRIKTIRLFLHLAEQTKLVDSCVLLTRFNIPTGSSARWIRPLADGTFLTLKKP